MPEHAPTEAQFSVTIAEYTSENGAEIAERLTELVNKSREFHNSMKRAKDLERQAARR